MKKSLSFYLQTFRIVFASRRYVLGFITISILLFWLFLYIPVTLIPGNDFAFQLSILAAKDIFSLGFLAILTALSLLLHVYLLQRKVGASQISLTMGSGLAGSTIAVVGSLFATASCAACIATLLGFLGVGTIFFLIDHRQLIIVFSVIMMLISLHFTAQKVLGVCEICNINYKRKKKYE